MKLVFQGFARLKREFLKANQKAKQFAQGLTASVLGFSFAVYLGKKPPILSGEKTEKPLVIFQIFQFWLSAAVTAFWSRIERNRFACIKGPKR